MGTRTPRSWSVALVAVTTLAALLTVATGPASADPGDLDTSVGTGGTLGLNLLTVPDDDAAADAIAVSGGFLTVGWAGGTGIVVTKLTTSGDIDTGFGNGGTVRVAPDPAAQARPAVDQFAFIAPVTGGFLAGTGRLIVRLGPSGTRDPSFDGDGILDLGATLLGAHAYADGRLLVATSAGITRILANGTVDAGFAGDGRAEVTGRPGGVLALPSGRILYGARDTNQVRIEALTNGGAADGTFDVSNSLTFSPVGAVREFVADGADLYALIGTGTNDPGDPVRVVSFTEVGVRDAGFGSNGVATVNPAGSIDDAHGLAIDGSDRVLVAGSTTGSAVDGPLRAFTARLLPNGALDPTFGAPGGIVERTWATQSVGRAVVPGGTTVTVFGHGSTDAVPFAMAGGGDLVMDGLTVLGFPDGGVGTNVHPLVTIRSIDEPRDLLPLSDGSTLVVGQATAATGVDAPVLAKVLPDGTIDGDFGDGGRVRLPDGALLSDFAIDSRDRIIAAYQLDENGVLVHRYGPDGALDESYGGDGTGSVPFLFGVDGTSAVASGPSDEAVVIRTLGNNVIFHSLDDTGELRDDYGTNGRTILGYTNPQVVDAVLDRDGDLVIAANQLADGAPDRGYLLKLGSDGRLAKFGTIGRKFVPESATPGGRTKVQALAIGSDGRAIAIGSYLRPTAPFAPERRFALQVDVGGEPLPLYGLDGNALVGVTDGAVLADAAVDRTGLVHMAEATGTASRVRRLDQRGAVDPSFGTSGAVAAAVSRTFDGPISISPDGFRILASGASDGDVSLTAIEGEPVPVPAAFTAVDPVRILDTRNGNGGPTGKIPAGTKRFLQVTGRGGVPNGATAVVLTLTVTQPDGGGYITAWGDGARPLASNVNFVAGQTIPNQAIVPLDGQGRVQLYAQGTTHLIADVAGYFVPADGGTSTGGRFRALPPARLLDTRTTADGAAKVPAGTRRRLTVVGRGGVPATGVSAAVFNVTVTQPDGGGYVTVFPAAATRPLASNVNFVRGETAPDHVTVKLSPTGAIDLYTSQPTHLIVDVLGYYTDDTAGASSRGLFVPLRPSRLLDTRVGNGVDSGFTNRQSAGANLPVLVTARGGVPLDGVGSLVLNATITQTAASGYRTVYPSGIGRPLASNLNFVANDTRANLVSVPVGDDGRVVDFPSQAAHLLLDVAGYFVG